HCARAGEARIDVDHLRAALPGLHHPLESDRVVLGHVRAHDQDAVRVLQVLLEGRRTASAERGPQTGDRGAVSYARLVPDLDDAAVLDVHELGAADGAVRADRMRHLICLVDARCQRPRALRAYGTAQPERVALSKLPYDRPRLDELREAHRALSTKRKRSK